ncbi:uncharacterized protein L969DRAFT_54435 [Mixia osmundae IAM 14324]|uniref:NAD-dependent epimerase/dehydratase domain-containing protein n=1 Tax=Mixia osmundae (strain CBS 9802 / IAM 14324 / JCM 22182 / KY 12970) TaxID=764103 RepID=G7E1R9_MIXOS|nr:uncharacterized protein L969DRAFT_54435 [Mixia osmundae IAM 14324]KEI36728.1 hypothetical protein L969DRAFT_54435 [Mixia osmundae IAM 14324]GAA96779.1 hypothetical protein E5Q_03450 [Mixia osmundae IAM 14324]
MTHKLLCIGGNGFVGSAICKTAISRGWQVHSLSRSGKPYASDKGHQPAWSKRVNWHSGSALEPDTYKHVLAECTAVVNATGTLLEGDYKSGGISSLVKELFNSRSNNPLAPGKAPRSKGQYELLNRDAALTVFRALQDTQELSSSTRSTPFVFISAEDIFRPFIPERYIATKREAEQEMTRLVMARAFPSGDAPVEAGRDVRPVFLRPSLIYHPHIRPISTLPAAMLDLSATIQSKLPVPLRASAGAAIFASLLPASTRNDLPPSAFSMSNLLSIPPIHVDTLAEAACRAIADESIEGALGVQAMRDLVGWNTRSNTESEQRASEETQTPANQPFS